MKKTLKYVLAATALVTSLGTLASCGGDGDKPNPGTSVPPSGDTSTPDKPVNKTYTNNTYTSVSPSNWNQLTYQDQNDLQIISYINSSFFKYDYLFDENNEIVEGKYSVKYDSAKKLEDVTDTYRAEAKWKIPAEGKGYAYKITLRDDIKWDDGTEIHAEDFVYSMQQQLDPKFKNYRADSYYNGSTVLTNAKGYAYQGMKGWYGSNTPYTVYDESLDSKLVFTLGNAAETAVIEKVSEDKAAVAAIRDILGLPEELTAGVVAQVLCANFAPNLDPAKLTLLEGKTFEQIKASPELKATYDALIAGLTAGAGFETNDTLLLFVTNYEFPVVAWEDVGIFAAGKDELVIVLEKPLQLLEEDGSLSFKAAYNMSSLPLVKKDLYEANKVEPVKGSSLWTSTYNSSLASTASWGPYKLTQFQSGKQFILERNKNWYGYNMEENKNKYQTDRIVCQTLKDWNTAWLSFQKGDIDSIGIDVSIAKDYKNSSQAIFTPSDFIGSMQLQSDKAALKNREKPGVNKTILAQTDFRKAISLGINRAEYNAKCTTSSKPGFGLFNSMHYYDVEHGGVYRDTDEAKKVLCDTYGVNWQDPKYGGDLDEAVGAITGYDPVQAKALINSAYDKALEAGDIKETDKVVLEFGSGDASEPVMRIYDFLSKALKDLVKGTKLDGRLETEFKDHGAKWSQDFRNGTYEICTGGWSGAAWDPGYFLLAYLSPDYMYSKAWDTSKVYLELTLKGAGKDGADLKDNLTLMEWYDCLNGNPDCKYNFSEGAVDVSVRLQLIAALEKRVLGEYYTVPLQNGYSAELISFKTEMISRDYNTFMSYGGIEYMTYNYSDDEWADYVSKNTLDYKA